MATRSKCRVAQAVKSQNRVVVRQFYSLWECSCDAASCASVLLLVQVNPPAKASKAIATRIGQKSTEPVSRE